MPFSHDADYYLSSALHTPPYLRRATLLMFSSLMPYAAMSICHAARYFLADVRLFSPPYADDLRATCRLIRDTYLLRYLQMMIFTLGHAAFHNMFISACRYACRFRHVIVYARLLRLMPLIIAPPF